MPIGPASVRAEGSTREAVKEFFAAEVKNAEKIQRHTLGLSDDEDVPPYVYQPYPKAMYPYAEGDDPIVVENESQEQARIDEGYFATLAEAQAHYANGFGDGEEEGGGDEDEGEILAVAETGDASLAQVRRPPARSKRRPAARRKRA
jgi:hypothetical protein